MRVDIDVRHLARIEGHGNIVVRIADGDLKEARWDVVETPRFFEVMLKGKHFSAAGILAARICGICSISHCLTAVRATERAFGVTVPDAAARLRLLAKHGETIQSHVLHFFFLAAPDFLGLSSAIPLVEADPEVLQRALRLKGLANRLCDAVAGRTTHPVAFQPGGVSMVPEKRVLSAIRNELEDGLDDLHATARLLATFEIPDFERETKFVALRGEREYPFIGGRLVSSDGVERAENEYLEMTNEAVVAGNTSKWSSLSRESYAVGPLARCNLNFELLHPEARQIAANLGLAPLCHNPFMAHVARLVECVHCAHEAIRLVDEIVSSGDEPAMVAVAPVAGEGVGAVEAPRGILFHHYRYGGDGRIESANCVVPTAQNNGNIHRDLPDFVRQMVESGVNDDQRLELLCSMLVRSYDPCLSCSVH